MSYRDDAKSAKAGKVARVLGGANRSTSDAVMASEGAKGTPTMTKAIDRGTTKAEGEKSKKRMDRPARARGGSVKKGKTNVTVIVAPQGGQQGAPGVSVAGGPAAGASPVVPPPAAMPPGAGAPPAGAMPPRPPMAAPGGMPMRKRGGPVMKAGAGSGIGRLEKAADA